MSESLHVNPMDKPKTPRDIFNSFGDNLKYGWDIMQEAGNFSALPENLVNVAEFTEDIKDKETGEITKETTIKKTFNEEKFFETFKNLHPSYLEYASGLFEEDFESRLKIDAKHETKEQEQQRRDYLVEITQSFIKRIEFYSRLTSPEKLALTGRTPEQFITALEQAGMRISDYARHLLESEDFRNSLTERKKQKKDKEELKLVRLTVKDLGFSKGATFEQIYNKAQELGLELCPPEVGPEYRLQYTNQPMSEWVRIGMKQISGPGGYPYVFHVVHYSGGVWLSNDWVDPVRRWPPENEFVFRLRKPEREKVETI